MSERKLSLSLLSGKGGSGKTVLGLCMCRALAEAGYKVLLVDCDFVTHGAAYFFEDKLRREASSLSSIASSKDPLDLEPTLVEDNFWFLPSSASPEEIKESRSSSDELSTSGLLEGLLQSSNFDVVVFDCQAGYSPLVRKVAEIADQNIIVMEPDAVSASALRVLFLQLGSVIRRSNTWQLFNKITEDEREVYEKLSGGTLFPNLPPIPFDWQVRAAFATSDIPSVTSRSSAFGLGVLRILKIVFRNLADKIETLERETVGKWHEDIVGQMEELQLEKRKIEFHVLESSRRMRLQRVKLTAITIAFVGLMISAVFTVDFLHPLKTNLLGLMPAILGLFIAVLATVWYGWSLKDIGRERDRAVRRVRIREVERELERYSTLLATEPWLREYVRQKRLGASPNDDSRRSA
jgi:cellulose biosynthesis protein BcsQ